MTTGGRWTGRASAIALTILGAFCTVPPTGAVEFKSGENVTIGAGETIRDDLYMTGDTMTVAGRVIGDVVAAGRVIHIDGVVEGDLIAAAQAIVIRGEITDDVRIAGMSMLLGSAARVGDDAFAAGFSFVTEGGSRVTGKTGLTGFQALLGGEHQQGLEASLIGLQIEGQIGGNVEVQVDSEAGPVWWTRFVQSPVPFPVVAPGLRLANGARVDGRVRYTSMAEAEIGPRATIAGGLERVTPKISAEPVETFGDRLLEAVRWFVVLLLLGAVLLWLFPDKIVGVADTLDSRPWGSLGWGVVTLIGFPVILLLVLVLTAVLSMAFGMVSLAPAVVLIVVVGMLGVLLLAGNLWAALFYLAPVLVSFAAGRRLLRGAVGIAGQERRYRSLLLGLVLLILVTFLPIIGTALRALVMICGVGAGALWAVRSLAASDRKATGELT